MWMSTYERDLAADKLDFLKAVGVSHICGDDVRGFGFEELGYWDAGKLEDARKHCEVHGISLDMLTLPLNSVSVDRSAVPNIIKGDAGARRRDRASNQVHPRGVRGGDPGGEVQLHSRGRVPDGAGGRPRRRYTHRL
jgi:hypothetical protein